MLKDARDRPPIETRRRGTLLTARKMLGGLPRRRPRFGTAATKECVMNWTQIDGHWNELTGTRTDVGAKKADPPTPPEQS